MSDQNRESAINAVDTLNDLIGDFITGTMVLVDYDQQFRSGELSIEQRIGIEKMCVSHLMLGLCKFTEFRDRFHELLRPDQKEEVGRVCKVVEQKKVREFRNKCIGHIWDRELNRPLRNSEIMRRLEVVYAGDLGSFLRWINNPENNSNSRCVRTTAEDIRHDLMTSYKIKPKDVLER